MANYVIGDVQGCLPALEKLLDKIRFRPGHDQLWFAGDLVNRGPDSLGVLRLVSSLGNSVRCVLGNHDLHMLAVYSGYRKAHRRDTLDEIFASPDHHDLMNWLRHQPLMFTAYDRSHVLCHAGLYPLWTLEEAEQEARYVEQCLRTENYQDLFAIMYGNSPSRWKPGRNDEKRLRFAINCFTRMRYCQSDGSLEFHEKGKPGSQSDGLLPWYELPGRKNRDRTIMFGHWSTVGETGDNSVIALDTGCVWGGYLTAYEPVTGNRVRVRCDAAQKPG